MNILIIGDIVGKNGCGVIKDKLAGLKNQYNVDFCIANGENVAGIGVKTELIEMLLNRGVDVITLGNHTWDRKDIFNVLDKYEQVIRPANYHPDTPGNGYYIVNMGHIKIAVINLLGRIFMDMADCPFRCADNILKQIQNRADIIVVDFHAEATSEKQALGLYLDGRTTVVYGTHTHVQTADERILPGHTAYITDVGMTGPLESVIGMKKETALPRFITKLPGRLEVADGTPSLCGILVEVDENTFFPSSITRINVQ